MPGSPRRRPRVLSPTQGISARGASPLPSEDLLKRATHARTFSGSRTPVRNQPPKTPPRPSDEAKAKTPVEPRTLSRAGHGRVLSRGAPQPVRTGSASATPVPATPTPEPIQAATPTPAPAQAATPSKAPPEPDSPTSPLALAFPEHPYLQPGFVKPPKVATTSHARTLSTAVPSEQRAKLFGTHIFVEDKKTTTLMIGEKLVCIRQNALVVEGTTTVVQLYPEPGVSQRFSIPESQRRFWDVGHRGWLKGEEALTRDMNSPRDEAGAQPVSQVFSRAGEDLGCDHKIGETVFLGTARADQYVVTNTEERRAFYTSAGARLVFKGLYKGNQVLLQAGRGILSWQYGQPAQYWMNAVEFDELKQAGTPQ